MRERSADHSNPEEWFVVGAPIAGSSVGDGQASAGSSAGAISRVDPSFDPDAFLAWSCSVYERGAAAWRYRNPELLRPVMAQAVWDRYAQFLVTLSAVALSREIMASAVAQAALAWTGADPSSQSALVAFSVTVADPRGAIIDKWAAHWQERWLFQRPAGSRTHASGRVAVCLACGGPADPEDSGRCPYCHADITTRTAGWVVTQVATTLRSASKIAAAQSAAPAAATPLQPPRALP
jgi:hypothetical protein